MDSSEGWSLVRVLTGSPQVVGQSVRWQDRTYRLKERYTATTTRVLGEFYWRVQRNEQGEVADYEGPQELILGREQSRSEVSWSQGRKLDATEVLSAFGMSSAMRRASGDVRPLSGGGDALKGILVFLLIAMLLVGMVKGCSDDDCDKVRRGFGEQSLEYQQCLAGQRSSSGGWRVPSGGGGGSGFGGGGHK